MMKVRSFDVCNGTELYDLKWWVLVVSFRQQFATITDSLIKKEQGKDPLCKWKQKHVLVTPGLAPPVKVSMLNIFLYKPLSLPAAAQYQALKSFDHNRASWGLTEHMEDISSRLAKEYKFWAHPMASSHS